MERQITITCEIEDQWVLDDLVEMLEITLGYMTDNHVINTSEVSQGMTHGLQRLEHEQINNMRPEEGG